MSPRFSGPLFGIGGGKSGNSIVLQASFAGRPLEAFWEALGGLSGSPPQAPEKGLQKHFFCIENTVARRPANPRMFLEFLAQALAERLNLQKCQQYRATGPF